MTEHIRDYLQTQHLKLDADAVRGTGRPRYEAGSGTLAAAYKGERSRTA